MGGLGGFYGLNFSEHSMESLGILECLEGVDSEAIFDLILCIENVLLGGGEFWNGECFDTLFLCSVQEFFVMGRTDVPKKAF